MNHNTARNLAATDKRLAKTNAKHAPQLLGEAIQHAETWANKSGLPQTVYFDHANFAICSEATNPRLRDRAEVKQPVVTVLPFNYFNQDE